MQTATPVSRPADGRRLALPRLPSQAGFYYLLGGVLAVVASLLVFSILHAAHQGEPVLIVAREVAVGQAIAAADLKRVDDGRLPEATRPIAVPVGQASALIGQFATRRLLPGVPLLEGDVTGIPPLRPGFAEVSVPIKPETAPPLAPGMRVDVIEINAGGEKSTRTPIVRGATVRQILVNGGSALSGNGGEGAAVSLTRTVTALVLVKRDLAPVVAEAAAPGRVALVVAPEEAERP